MASVVDIVNQALTHISNSAEVTSIDPPDGSAEADHAARFYPIIRDVALESHAWSFATARKVLAQLDVNPMDGIWAYAYGLPNQMIRPLALLMPESTDDAKSQPYLMETNPEDGSGIIYTNVEDAVLKYIYRQEDPTKFTPMFVVGLGTLLGSVFAGPIAKDIKLKEGLWTIGQRELAHAASLNKAQKVNLYRDFVPSQIAARS